MMKNWPKFNPSLNVERRDALAEITREIARVEEGLSVFVIKIGIEASGGGHRRGAVGIPADRRGAV